jgi:hypothetical protein
MKPRTPSSLNNLAIVLLQSNCFRPALTAFQDAELLQQKKCLPSQRRYSAEAVPPPLARAVSIEAVDLNDISKMPCAWSLLEFLKVKTSRKALLLVRLPKKSPFAATILYYNQAMGHLAASFANNKDNVEQCNAEAKHALKLASVTLQKWYACLTKVNTGHSNLIRATLMLLMLVTYTLYHLTNVPSLIRRIQAIQARISSHDSQQSVLGVGTVPLSASQSNAAVTV